MSVRFVLLSVALVALAACQTTQPVQTAAVAIPLSSIDGGWKASFSSPVANCRGSEAVIGVEDGSAGGTITQGGQYVGNFSGMVYPDGSMWGEIVGNNPDAWIRLSFTTNPAKGEWFIAPCRGIVTAQKLE